MNILLVDDEVQLRTYLRTLVDWEGHGYTLFEADNGRAAIQIMQETEIHLLMLDITMPVMSGLEVLQWVQENNYLCVSAMITNNDEIHHAQQAMRMGCSDYIIKSEINPDVILGLAAQMQTKLSWELQERQRRDALEVSLRRQGLLEVRRAVAFWLRNGEQAGLDIARLFEEKVGWSDRGARYTLLRVAILDYTAVVARYTTSDIAGFSTVFDGQLNELLADLDCFYTEPEPGEFIIVTRFGTKVATHDILNRVQHTAQRIATQFAELLGIHCHLLYTLPFAGCAGAAERYARMAPLKHIGFWGAQDEISCLEDCVLDEQTCADELEDFETRLADALSRRTLSQIETVLDTMVARITDQHLGVSPQAVQSICESVVASFLRAQSGDTVRGHLPASPKDWASYRAGLVEQIGPHTISEEDQGRTLLVKKATLLIQQHYEEDIGLEWLAARLFVNPSYLSRIFSHEAGQPITAYINAYRIEQAKRLIRTSNIRLYEVGERVGFSSPVVFSSTFKKITGETASEYRNRVV